AKRFGLEIAAGRFGWSRDAAAIQREEQLDGISVIRTRERAKAFPSAACGRTYKSLAQVEQAFRCFKGLDLRVRPIHHRVDPRVRAHLFLCLLAYAVEWQMRRGLGAVAGPGGGVAGGRGGGGAREGGPRPAAAPAT